MLLKISLTIVICFNCFLLCHGDEIQLRPKFITKEVETTIDKALAYLVKNQARSGLWYANGRSGGYPCAMTSLAGLALLASGNTPLEGKYAINVQRAVQYVLSCTNESGLISNMSQEQRSMYGHGFAMMFLGQVYGMGTDDATQRRIRKVLKKAIKLTAKSQSSEGGWLYEPDSNGDEGSVTITQIQGLRSCRNAGFKVPKKVITRACEYISKCSNSDGGIAYSLGSRGASRPAITAAAVATLYNAGKYDNKVAVKALDFLLKTHNFDSKRLKGGHAFYMMMYLSQAMYFSHKKNWARYFPNIRDALVKAQNTEGSWNGDYVGRVYGTSIGLLVLQLPYSYLPLFQR
ncbi:MAG: hypothetical protein COA79_13555 [Planctomycetota bacterium]|nr:MAG: hypothetical protein COA79_13555 [Planctomycetota bacterium]